MAASEVSGLSAGDPVATHSVPLRDQGTWAEVFIAAAGHVAPLARDVRFDAGAGCKPACSAARSRRGSA
jgi:NADPH:quinone reductase-like Zn-dependent oxidoreductase